MTEQAQTPATVDSGGATLAVPEKVQQMLADVGGFISQQSEVDADQISLEIMERILNSESAEEVLDNQSALHSRDVLGVPHHISKVKWQHSDYEGGPAFFAVVTATTPDGEITYTCGSRNVMAALYRLLELGAVSQYPVVIRQTDRPAQSGNFPQWLERATAENTKS